MLNKIEAIKSVNEITIKWLENSHNFDELIDEILTKLDHEIFNSFVVNLGCPDLALETIVGHIVATANEEFGQVILIN